MSSEDDPFTRFKAWFEQAAAREPSDHDAAALASVDGGGQPSVRMVLVRGYDRRGFVFYTNLDSRKGLEYGRNPRAALCFHWKSTERQIRIEGMVAIVDDAEADAYFATRPRESQIGAWASRQSRILESRAILEQQVERCSAQYGDATIPRPPFWSGYRLSPERIEFWDKRPFRLHDRNLYTRSGDTWSRALLYP